MKQLLNGVAIVAVLAIAAPVWAQRTGPGVGAPGPNQPLPGGPGPSSPLSNLPAGSPGLPPGQQPYAPPPAATMPPASMGDTTSATPPTQRHARASTHHRGMNPHPPSAMSGTTAAQLNQEELNRLQSGNFSNPPAPPPPAPAR